MLMKNAWSGFYTFPHRIEGHSALIRSNTVYQILSQDIMSGSDITPYIKINRPLVVYIFGNMML